MVASTVKTVELGIVARSKDSTCKNYQQIAMYDFVNITQVDSSYLLIWYA